MFKIYDFILLIILIGACTEIPEQEINTTVISTASLAIKQEKKSLKEYGIQLKPDSTKTYAQVKLDLSQERQRLKSKDITQDSLAKIFTNHLVNKIIPYWYGTSWSFEGHTSKPGVGEIACGYFVSTTLRDLGLNINRYKLAQQAPINEARTLQLSDSLLVVKGRSDETIKTLQKQLKEGIYFIGFDQNHVGYILKRDEALFLMHSNYIASEGVLLERIETSEVFASYNRFYIAALSTNSALLKQWLNGVAIQVRTE